MLHPRAEDALQRIVEAWLEYDDARSHGVGLPRLVELRMRLEELRALMHDIRRAHHPTADEVTEMAFAAFCDSIEGTVFIPYRAVRDSSYLCWCGTTAAVPAA